MTKLNDALVELRATVQGSGRAPYAQEILISGMDGGAIDIDGDCSCPVEYNCKHVVAACLAYHASLDSTEREVRDTSLEWLERFARAGRGENPATATGVEFIAYILHPGQTPSELAVEFLITRRLKNGGIGKGRRTELHQFASWYSSAAYAQEEDHDIGRLIEAQKGAAWGYRTYPLRGELGFLALSRMLDTGRCFWADVQSPPLRFGESRELRLDWQEEKHGDRRLEIGVVPQAMVLNSQPALYLDTQTGVIGPLRGADFTTRQWALLLEAPVVVPAKASAEFSQHLLTDLPQTPLPPPLQLDTVAIQQQPPIPHLHLFSDENPVSGQRVHMMRLRFAYAGHELAPMPSIPVHKRVDGQQVIVIQRDLPAEQSALEKLHAAEFQSFADEQHGDLFFVSGADNLMTAAARWQLFLETTLPGLEAEGWKVEFAPDFQLQFLHADNWAVNIDSDDESNNDWFDLRFDLQVQGRKLPLLPLIAEALNHYEPDTLPDVLTLPLGDNQYLQLPAERIRPICETLYELYDAGTLNDDGALRMSRFDAARLTELEKACNHDMRWRGGKALRALGRKLKDFDGIKQVTPPRTLKADLREYQKQGLSWLQFLRTYEFNGVLADDMGLGKTVQTLAHLLLEKAKKRLDRPCLIIAPTSLMSNWRREAQRFAPSIKVLVLHGPERKQHFDDIDSHDVILSTYPLLARDHETLLAHEYHYLILDEAQVIKNPRAKAARLARDIRARHRLCLTGTPMENHLGELWALFDFLMPGFLGDSKLFTQRFRTPIEKNADTEQRARLARRVAPFMLRRRKADVIKELPAKTEILRTVALEGKQAALYESIRLSMEKKVRDAIAKKGLARSHITILDALLKLRQTCCDPRLLPLAQAKKVGESAKLDMLMEMLPEMLEEGRRILLFSQFTTMLAIIERRLLEAGIGYTKLTGQTRNRDAAIERFRQGEVNVFLISLKAGGVGLNLTEADTVIHYDPWWNPAVENQATDRAHRIGQDKAVFVYKLITENTLEEKILAMQARKQALADGVYKQGNQGEGLKLDANDLQELFAPLALTG
ncbi:MAG: DEAD/DEAH box helicase [Gammaproteobacteria bacterium]|nr:DEAD/DEAH box helicase [Gammaproteobacteria bacterium]